MMSAQMLAAATNTAEAAAASQDSMKMLDTEESRPPVVSYASRFHDFSSFTYKILFCSL